MGSPHFLRLGCWWSSSSSFSSSPPPKSHSQGRPSLTKLAAGFLQFLDLVLQEKDRHAERQHRQELQLRRQHNPKQPHRQPQPQPPPPERRPPSRTSAWRSRHDAGPGWGGRWEPLQATPKTAAECRSGGRRQTRLSHSSGALTTTTAPQQPLQPPTGDLLSVTLSEAPLPMRSQARASPPALPPVCVRYSATERPGALTPTTPTIDQPKRRRASPIGVEFPNTAAYWLTKVSARPLTLPSVPRKAEPALLLHTLCPDWPSLPRKPGCLSLGYWELEWLQIGIPRSFIGRANCQSLHCPQRFWGM